MPAELDHPAFVLHTRSYRETSLIVELFVRDIGRKGVIARGARGAKSKHRGLLQPNRRLRVSWSGRGELGTLTQVEADGISPRLEGRRLWSALYINELLDRLLMRDDPHPQLFDTYAGALNLLADAGIDEEPVLRLFEKRLVSELGYGLILDHEPETGEALSGDQRYVFDPQSGPSRNADTDGIPIDGDCLLAFAEERLVELQCLRQIKRLMRLVLRQYLGEKPLKSRELFERQSTADHQRDKHHGAPSS